TYKFLLRIKAANGNGLSKDTTVSLITIEGATDSPKTAFDNFALGSSTFVIVTYSPPGKSGIFPADIRGIQTVTKNGAASDLPFPGGQTVNVTVP
ncbi:MAG: hypothetical protein HYU64_14060, partial [Armatimonadetes bacterium]|nr:hypothetical protein [Armatimonadota bacterium]